MINLDAREAHTLTVCRGWIQLAEYHRAIDELDSLPAHHWVRPEVMDLRAIIQHRLQNWQECLELASALVQLTPGRSLGWVLRSFALFETGRTREALDFLLPATKFFPEDWVVRYNLACYLSRLSQTEEAWYWLEAAYNLCDPVEISLAAIPAAGSAYIHCAPAHFNGAAAR